MHTDAATSFVMDIADLYKADYTIPLAFDLAAKGLTSERDARLGMRDRIAEDRLLGRIVDDVKMLLTPTGADIPEEDVNELWDEKVGTVAGGVNWSGEADLVEPSLEMNTSRSSDLNLRTLAPIPRQGPDDRHSSHRRP